MQSDSDSEDLDISLFSKKFKESKDKIKKEKKKKDKTKNLVKEKGTEKSSTVEVRGHLNINDTKLGHLAVTSDSSRNDFAVTDKAKSLKRKQSDNKSAETKTAFKKKKDNDGLYDGSDMIIKEGKLPKKNMEKTKKMSSVKESSVSFTKSKTEVVLNRHAETAGTSSDESDLESDQISEEIVISKMKQRIKMEKLKKSHFEMDISDRTLKHPDKSKTRIDGSSSDTETSHPEESGNDSDTDSEGEMGERNSQKIVRDSLHKPKHHMKVEENYKDSKVDRSMRNISSGFVKGGKQKHDRNESDSSTVSDSETSDIVGGETDSVGNRNIDDSVKEVDSGNDKLFKRVGEETHFKKKKRIDEVRDELSEDSEFRDVSSKVDQDPYAAIKKELADIPLEDLVKIKDKLGLKVFRQILQGGKKDEPNQKRVFKRENKNRPMELSSKKPVPFLRQTNIPKKKMARDPRFDDLSGEFKEEYFERNYSFLQDVKAKEKEIVKKKLKKAKNEEKKEKLQYLLNRMNQQEQAAQQKQRRKELEMAMKLKEKQLIREGKNPYFLKKAERKKLELAERYKELQKTGKIDQYLSRKRQKNARKEKKKLPGKHARFHQPR